MILYDFFLPIQDTGIGMTRAEMIDHLGTIAKSGSQSFIDEVTKQPSEAAASNIIGKVLWYQFLLSPLWVELFVSRDAAQFLPTGYTELLLKHVMV